MEDRRLRMEFGVQDPEAFRQLAFQRIIWYSSEVMSVAEIEAELERMTVPEKLRIMEAVWADLSQHEKNIRSPEWHKAELKERKARVKAGHEQFVDWDTSKKELRNRFK